LVSASVWGTEGRGFKSRQPDPRRLVRGLHLRSHSRRTGIVPRTPIIAEFTDPRLVAIYDTVNAYTAASQPGFYAQLAAELGVSLILDLGCGTGLITCELARQGYRLIGVDPAPSMLDIARDRPYGDRVRWIDGDASQLGAPDADLAIMTGHVAQFFLADDSWHATLTALHAALRPGGRLAFESRNPGARQWEGGGPATPARRWMTPPQGRSKRGLRSTTCRRDRLLHQPLRFCDYWRGVGVGEQAAVPHRSRADPVARRGGVQGRACVWRLGPPPGWPDDPGVDRVRHPLTARRRTLVTAVGEAHHSESPASQAAEIARRERALEALENA
jgi:SAM-dependent methyltransferase